MPISFKFTSELKNIFIFENPDHDFPKRIVYEFIGFVSFMPILMVELMDQVQSRISIITK